MSFYEFDSTDQKSAERIEAKPELFRAFSDLDLKFDADSFKEKQTKATVELVKDGVLPGVDLFFGVDKPESPAKPPEKGSIATAGDKPQWAGRLIEERPKEGRDSATLPKEGEKPPEIYKSGDEKYSAKLEYDKDGKPVKFTDYNTDVYQRDNDGKWYRGEPMFNPPQEVKLSVSADGTVKIEYPLKDKKEGQFITRTIQKDGTEVTKYPEGVETTRIRTATGETLIVKSEKQSQTLQYDKDGNLVAFKANDGTRYEADRNGYWFVIEKDGTRRSLDKFNKDGGREKEGSVKADANGTVTVRDEGRRDPDKYVTRYINNGVVVSSDSTGGNRTTTTPDGLTIKDRVHGQREGLTGNQSTSRTFEYRDSTGKITGNITLVQTFDGRQRITGKIGGEEVKLQKDPNGVWQGTIAGKEISHVRTDKGNDTIQFRTEDGRHFVIDGQGKIREGLPPGKEIEDRSTIDEMPRDFKKLMEDRLEEIRKMKEEIANKYGYTAKELDEILRRPVSERPEWVLDVYELLYALAKDGGAFDDKQKGGQYQKWGNFAFGVYCRELGLSEFEAIKGTAFYKKFIQGKAADPADYEDIRRGLKYYDENIRPRPKPIIYR